MSGSLLQINFKLNVSKGEYEALASSLAQSFAEVSGLEWKIWLLNADERLAGGVYMFDGAESMRRFLDSDLAANVQAHPAIEEFSARTFDVMEAPTAITRGPVPVHFTI
jgi:hypothetical protein